MFWALREKTMENGLNVFSRWNFPERTWVLRLLF